LANRHRSITDADPALRAHDGASGALVPASGVSRRASVGALLRKVDELERERALLEAVVESFSSAVFLSPPGGPLRPLNAAAHKAAASSGAPLCKDSLERGTASPAIELPLAGHPNHTVIFLAAGHSSLSLQLDLATAQWGLTARQTLVLRHVADGLSNKEIAARLDCAEATVEQHLTALYRKAGAQGRPLIVALLWKLPA
jgi:DNA-binding CsgD family transcriptional regulator